jgi:hypothetical protein
MKKRSYKNQTLFKLEDIISGLSAKMMSIKMAGSTAGKEWVTGLTDIADDDITYYQMQTHDEAVALINELITNHHCNRGIDIGKNQTIVYISCEDI